MHLGGARGGGVGRRVAAALRPAALAFALALARPAVAQITLDPSIHPGSVPFDGTTWMIDEGLGARSGGNLFYSFSRFDVPAGEIASFYPLDPSIPPPSSVIARVTGHDASEIDGTLQSLHDHANLFLLNPSGFSFGPQSAVQVLGRLHVRTAEWLRCPGGVTFDARSDEPPPVLSADPPESFGFLSGAAAGISFDLDRPGTPFESPVPSGATFAVVGGDVRILGDSASSGDTPTLTPTIRIEGGSLEVASVRSAAIDVPVDVSHFGAEGQPAGALGEVEIGRNAHIDVESPGGASFGAGRVVIRAGKLVMDNARITDIAGSETAGSPVAVDLETSEEVAVRGGSQITLTSRFAPVGDLRIATPRVAIGGAATLIASTARGTAEAPNVRVAADKGDFSLGDGAQVQLVTQKNASAPGGRFSVEAGSVSVTGRATVFSETQGPAAGGAIGIHADSVSISGGSLQSSSRDTGVGGRIEIVAGQMLVADGGHVSSRPPPPPEPKDPEPTSGPGGAIDVQVDGDLSLASSGKILSKATGAASSPGGDVTVRAGGRILVSGQDSADSDATQISALTSSTSPGGRGGDLVVEAHAIEVLDAGQVRTTTSGAAPGGSLDVEADSLRIAGTAVVAGQPVAGLFARSDPADGFAGQAGAGGALTVAARVVDVDDGAISTRTVGNGNAGSLLIRGAERVSVRGTSELSTKGATGKGGNLTIADAGEVEFADGGRASASTLGSGDAGEVVVGADRISISGPGSAIFSQSDQGTGAAGNVRVDVGSRLEVRDGGRISVDSVAGGPAGNVTIDGGPDATVALVGGEIRATSIGTAQAGNVTINAGRDFVAGRGAAVRTSARQPNDTSDASGGRVSISARRNIYASDARIETSVTAGNAGGSGNGGDVGVPEPGGTQPDFAVLNRTSIVASTGDGKGGNIRVAGGDLLASQGVVINATSERGVSGTVQITGPDADLAGQITPLPSNFFDASKLMTAACEARRARAGSFVVQTRTAIAPLPDAPLSPPELAPVAEGPAAAGECAPAASQGS